MEKIHGHNRRSEAGARSPFIHIVTVAEERSSSITSHFRRYLRRLPGYHNMAYSKKRKYSSKKKHSRSTKRKYKSGTKKPMVKAYTVRYQ